MRRPLRRLTVCLLLVALNAAGRPAQAQAARLWLERGNAMPPLAQVPDFRALAAQVIPAVVSIQVEQRVKLPPGHPRVKSLDPLDFFHRYFGGEMPQEFHNRGLGSGFIIDTAGVILTNYHVVEDAESIEVTVSQPDGSERTVPARLVGSAPKYDVALLQASLDAAFPATYLGDSESIQIGDWVMAVGNPFGLSHSVSVGIISAKDRREIAPSGRQGLYNFLQTDASINPGNSGGPLINMRGEVIGINSAINASGAGIGFAIPINMVKEMLPELVAKGRYARSWVGIKVQPLTPELAQSYGLKRNNGALVLEVVAGSPAADQLREGDVVLQFDGKELRSASDLSVFASMAGVGKSVGVKIWRDGQPQTVSIKLTEFPDEEPVHALESAAEAGDLGLKVADVTPLLQRDFGLSKATGAVVRDVDPAGLAMRAGLRPGDLIVSVNGVLAASARAVANVVRQSKAGDLLRFKVSRQGAPVFLALRKP